MMKVIQLQNELNLQDVVKSTVDQYNKQMSLLTDDLISEAEKNSNTMNEYHRLYEGDTILDNCMGSGTTVIAAIREKRNFIGFELNKEYYDKACERIRLELAQPKLF